LPVPDAIEGNLGTKINEPEEPTREDGYTFTGWFDAENGAVKFSWPYTLAGDLTMHAQWRDDTLPPPPQYTISFDSHEGTAVSPVTGDEGKAVTEPAEPERAGYRFLGWFPTANGGAKYDWPHPLSADVTMHAQWIQQHTITFETYGGLPVPKAITGDTGTAVTKPADPKRTGYRFLGWFPTATGGAAYTWDHVLSADVTMHAQWMRQYTITFEPHGGLPVPAAVTGDTGAKVKEPAEPKRTGYRFLGWFDGDGAAYTWDHTLTADVTMHAQWVRQYTITFDSHGGSPVPAALTADTGTPVKEPAEPTRDGYRFLGWFPTASGGAAYTWDHTLTADVVMHAQWIERYTISFDGHGGSPVPAALTADTGTLITKPDPKKAGYRLLGWFSEESKGTEYTVWPHELTGNVAMHAQWVKQWTITFNSHEGTEVLPVTADEGAEVPEPVVKPTLKDYEFQGWFDQENGGTKHNWSQALTGDITVHAQWTPKVGFGIGIIKPDGSTFGMDETITISKGAAAEHETSFTAKVESESGYTVVQWYLNGGPLGKAGEPKSMTIEAENYAVGKYYLVAVVEKNGVYYSTDIYFTVTD
jgi:uncharacterized repeat protein (TIGR02543 family)